MLVQIPGTQIYINPAFVVEAEPIHHKIPFKDKVLKTYIRWSTGDGRARQITTTATIEDVLAVINSKGKP